MTITNHILAGSVIGLVVKEPASAIALSLASHFAMDALPHFGYPGNKGFSEALKHRLSYVVGYLTLILTITVSLILIVNNQWFALLCGIIAASPDVMGWYNFLAYEKKGKSAKGMLELFHIKFHRRIQKFERPWGIYIEIFTFITLLILALKNIP